MLAYEMVQRIGVVVTTYNRPDALRLVLASLEAQMYGEFEVVVADDGSGPETRAVVDEFSRTASYPVAHVWHEDRGFRAAAIRNRAVATLATDYLVFLDGDGVVRPDFLATHARLAEPGWYVRGNSLYLSPSLTETVLRDGIPIHHWGLPRWIRHHRDVVRLRPLFRLPLGVLRKYGPRRWVGSKTCNLGVWRYDFLAVNGLDEEYEGWGFEDSDLAIRLIKHGVFHKDGRCSLPVIHLWHEKRDQSGREANLTRLAAALESDRTWAERGVSRYLETPEVRAGPPPR